MTPAELAWKELQRQEKDDHRRFVGAFANGVDGQTFIEGDFDLDALARAITQPEITYQHKLARLVIDVLDAQQRYFRSRSPHDLAASKKLEAALRVEANGVLYPPKPPAQGKLL